ncbi:hypothetical protein [Botrimarina hoheduenensis]|uniref:PEP-CTERM protein-sorting domain-containing protein n=1 Tax=Botrimarina hoheduenensis TaxID=2528000 RepID=A0A5C5WCC5_9BACT|nr:hypothetical protein [Botrimarina hoheduenensis]TWT47715.1 hypothetical protein Pla111_13350 [Botrimarina hoheduenensis]
MSSYHVAARQLLSGIALTLVATTASAVAVATFDADQFNANGFRFGDFDDNFFGTFDSSMGLLSLDINDFDSNGDYFGGAGSDIAADFDVNTTQLEVRLQVGANNVAQQFRVTLKDLDGAGFSDEHVYEFDLTGISPVDGFVTLTKPLNLGPLFTQGGFGDMPGDGIQNYGLAQVQIQTVFGLAERLQVDIESVTLVDSAETTLIELTPATFASQLQSFSFGTFQETGVVDQTNGNFVINTALSATPLAGGGLGFTGLSVDFEATEYAIEVEARLLPGNAATSFNLLMGDNDGDDSGPGLGNEDFIFTVDTSEFNSSGFTTLTIPLGSGSESGFLTTFGFANGGDGLQNFDLSQLQIQVDADNSLGALGIEIARFSIVQFTPTAVDGDFNGDGKVDNGDLNLLLGSWGSPTVPASWINGFTSPVDNGELNALLGNWGFGVAGAAAVPEPTAVLIMSSMVLLLVGGRRDALKR